MKRWIHSAETVEMPDGYLRTTKFTAPGIRTDEQRNVLEAIEIAITEKFKQFDSMCDIQLHLTSDASWRGVVDEYEEGYYIQLEATRSGFNAFVQGDHVIRKPRNLSEPIARYNVDGNRGTVYGISKKRHF